MPTEAKGPDDGSNSQATGEDEVDTFDKELKALKIKDATPSSVNYYYQQKYKSYPINLDDNYIGRALIVTVTKDREGWKKDVTALSDMFLSLRIQTESVYDPTSQILMEKMRAFVEMSVNTNMVFVCFMGLGYEEEGKLIFKLKNQEAIDIWDKLSQTFANSMCLYNKPKIFLVQSSRHARVAECQEAFHHTEARQACRRCDSLQTPPGHDPISPFNLQGAMRHYLFVFASQPGECAVRDTCKGSLFIQTLAEKMKIEAHYKDVEMIIKEVMEEFEVMDEFERNHKQMPQIKSAIPKYINLFPGITNALITNTSMAKVDIQVKQNQSLKTTGKENESSIVESPRQMMSLQNPRNISSTDEKSKGTEYSSRYQEEYVQEKRLGKGGFGVVFKAKNKLAEQSYAIKRIPLHKSDRAIDKDMREVKSLAKLDHPNIVRYYASWIERPPPGWQEEQDRALDGSQSSTWSSSPVTPSVDPDDIQKQRTNPTCFQAMDSYSSPEDASSESTEDKNSPLNTYSSNSSDCGITFEASGSNSNQPTSSSSKSTKPVPYVKKLMKLKIPVPNQYLYIQMQLCKPETLKDWLEQNKNRHMTQLMTFFQQIVIAVDHIHDSEFIHRDLKPSNILFGLDGSIKVSDLGLVKPLGEHDSANGSNLKTRRHTEEVGTKLYMSPEQEAGKTYCNKVDIFSLGMIFLELYLPFSTESERRETLWNAKKTPPQSFPASFINDHKDQCEFTTQLLSHDPSKRPSAREILDHALIQEFKKTNIECLET